MLSDLIAFSVIFQGSDIDNKELFLYTPRSYSAKDYVLFVYYLILAQNTDLRTLLASDLNQPRLCGVEMGVNACVSNSGGGGGGGAKNNNNQGSGSGSSGGNGGSSAKGSGGSNSDSGGRGKNNCSTLQATVNSGGKSCRIDCVVGRDSKIASAYDSSVVEMDSKLSRKEQLRDYLNRDYDDSSSSDSDSESGSDNENVGKCRSAYEAVRNTVTLPLSDITGSINYDLSSANLRNSNRIF